MRDSLKISIITVTFNSSETIADAVESLKSQSYPNVEHIVIDGASKDDTVGIVKALRPASIVVSEPDQGMYYALNKGIALATGDVIGILHSDDYFSDSNVIADVAQEFENGLLDGIYGDLVYVNPRTKRIQRTWKSGEYLEAKFMKGWMPPHPTFFVRRHVYEKYGGYNTLLRTAADYEMFVRLLHIHRIRVGYLPRVMVHMRAGGMSNRNLKSRLKAHFEDYRAWSFNNVRPEWYTVILKPLRKIWQYL